MKILMIASEALPFSKTGGLGDVIASLSAALAIENEVKLIIPCITENLLADIVPVFSFSDIDSPSKIEAILLKSNLSSPFETFLIQEESTLTRKGVYGDETGAYHNNCQRYALFSRLALNAVAKLDWVPDIIHVHDWPTALIPTYLKCSPWKEVFSNVKTIFSIHNLGYQGEFSIRNAHDTYLPGKKLPIAPQSSKMINFMSAALKDADKITTVSPTYAKEILTEEFSFNLASLLLHRKKDLYGILNGIDLEKWNPENDLNLPAPFSKTNLVGKEKCKQLFLKEIGLKNPKKPLLSMITRLADQKGIKECFDEEFGAIKQICKNLDVNVMVIGTGEKWCEEVMQKWNKEFSNFCAINVFNEELSHRAEAASDFFLMPSRYEPCGLNQMYSSHYGTLPIVRHTGGLADTVIPLTQKEENATGYSFYDLTPTAIFETVRWAISIMKEDPKLHKKLLLNGMNQDFSWTKSAKEYQKIYKS